MTKDQKTDCIAMGLLVTLLTLAAFAIGYRIWTVGDTVRTTQGVRSGQSVVSLSYTLLFVVFLDLVALIGLARTWRDVKGGNRRTRTKS